MNYKTHSDEELRRVLLTDPDDTSAICEAAERFANQVRTYDEDDEAERIDKAFTKGQDAGYDNGYVAGKRDYE